MTLVVAVLFVLVSWYGILDAQQYVSEEGGRLVAYRGHPRYSLPGYPQPIWTYAFGSERLAPNSEARSLPMMAELGKPVAILVESRLDPLVLAEQRKAAGERGVARSMTLALQNAKFPFETQFGARLLFSEVAEEQDVPLLRRWTNDQRSEIRLAAIRALLRLDPRIAVGHVMTDLWGGPPRFDHSDLLRRLEGQCSPELERYLKRLTQVPGTSPSVTEIIDATVRIGCRLDETFLLAAAERLQIQDASSLAGYAVWAGLTTHERVRRLDIADDWRRFLLQAYLPDVGCDPAWATVLSRGRSPALLPAILATARHCQGVRLQIRWTNLIDFIQLMLTREDGSQQQFTDVFDGGTGPSILVAYLPLLQQVLQPDPKAIHAAIILSADSRLRAAFLDLLMYWGDRVGLFTDFLDSNDIDLRRAYTDFSRTADPEGLATRLLDRIGRSDLFYTSLLGRMKQTPKMTQRLQAMLLGTREERRAAACVLAMQAPAADVIALLTDPDGDQRSAAADCATYNEEAAEIALKLPDSKNGFPIDGVAAIQDQVRRKLMYQKQLDGLPLDLRTWRIAIADTTPGMFGFWGPGMRDWFVERRFQARFPTQPEDDDRRVRPSVPNR